MVGQERLKKAYLANLVDPRIGGLLISGPKGTGKSTVVHSVRALLPSIEVVEGCPFRCRIDSPATLCTLCRERDERRPATVAMRIVNLPLSCTEDRLIGSINIEKLLGEGRREVQPGILGEANGNILYVDEVNLLPDHLVDDILDAAAGHWNTIEREGISLSHAADFVLVGSMNPEEGDLRPQILDRFPLCARVETIRDASLRVEIVRRNLDFETDSDRFHRLYEQEEAAQRDRIHEARLRVGEVGVAEHWVETIAASCAALKVDGQRPDIVMVKTARALAAVEGRPEVIEEDVLLAAELALNHRTRDGGLLDPPDAEEILSAFRHHSAEAARAAESRSRATGPIADGGVGPRKTAGGLAREEDPSPAGGAKRGEQQRREPEKKDGSASA